jgi:hypothetical protein
MQKRDLCSECFEARSPDAREFASAQRDARCEYCGDQPCAGGTDLLDVATGVQKLRFICMPCSMERIRFIQEHLQHDASELSQQEQLAGLWKLDEEAEDHMRRWVSERGLH